MRERFREMNLQGAEYTTNLARENYLTEHYLTKESFFEENRVYSLLNSEVKTLLEEVVNNDNARFFFGMEKDRDYQVKYDSLINELRVRGIKYLR